MMPSGNGVRRFLVAVPAALLVAPGTAAAQDRWDSEGTPEAGLVVEVRAEQGERLTAAAVVLHGPLEETAAGAATRVSLVPARAARYRADGLAAGRYRLDVTAYGYEPLSHELWLPEGRTTFHRVVLETAPVGLPRLLAHGVPQPDGSPPAHAVSRVDFTEQATAYRSVAEWLTLQPGVSTRQFGAGGRQVVGVRGSRPEAVLVLLDGIPINDPLTGAADLSSVPVASLQSAALVRGTSSSRYGAGATSGVLLLRSRAPSAAQWNASVEAGSFGYRAVDGYLSTSGSAGQVGLFLRHERAENDYPFVNRTMPGAPPERRRNADMSSWHASLGLSAAELPLSAQLRFDDRERGVPGRMGTRLFDGARWGDRSVQAALHIGRPQRGNVALGARLQRLLYEPGADRPLSSTRLSTINLAGTAPPLTPIGLELLGRVERESAEGSDLAIGAERWTAGASAARPFRWGRLGLQPALGFDVAPGQTAWSPELAFTAAPDPRLQAWARFGRGFRLPTFADLYFASAYRLEPNPDLVAETVVFDGELGARWGGRAGEAFELQAVAFRRVTHDPIVWLASAAAVWSPQNLDRLGAHGVELGAHLRSRDGTWRIGGQATYTMSRLGFGENRNPLPYEPTWMGSVVIERAAPAWGARAEVRYTGARSTSVAGTRRLPAYARVDLAGRTRVGLGAITLSLQARLLNALDQRYEYVELFPEPGRRFELRVEGF